MNEKNSVLNDDRKQRRFGLAICLFLTLYVILRANFLSLTYDEIITYEIQKTFSLSDAGKTANTHLLNTYLIRASCYFFGVSEFTLRLPNIIALLVYLLAAQKIVFFFKSDLRLHLLIFLTAMPFLVDFFSLARGYGLGVAFMLLSIYYFFRFINNNARLTAIMALIAGMISVLGSYTMINYFLPLTGLLILVVLLSKPSMKTKWVDVALIFATALTFLIIISPTLFELKDGGQLFFGGRTNIYYDTISSVGTCFGYHASYGGWVKGAFVLCFLISILISLAFLYRLIKTKPFSPEGYLSVLFLFSLVLVEIQNKIFQTNYPTERTALLYYPLMILVLFSGFNSLFGKKVKIINNAIVVVFCVHFFFTMNLTHCYSWRYDSGTKNMMADLATKKSEEMTLAIGAINGPSVNFYKERMGLRNINVEYVSDFWEYPFGLEEYNPYYYNADNSCNKNMFFDIKKVIRQDADYYYLDKFFLDEFKKANIKIEMVKDYPYSRTMLIKIPEK